MWKKDDLPDGLAVVGGGAARDARDAVGRQQSPVAGRAGVCDPLRPPARQPGSSQGTAEARPSVGGVVRPARRSRLRCVLALLRCAAWRLRARRRSPLKSQLKYRILDQFGTAVVLRSDYYPVARADERELARQRFPAIQKDADGVQRDRRAPELGQSAVHRRPAARDLPRVEDAERALLHGRRRLRWRLGLRVSCAATRRPASASRPRIRPRTDHRRQPDPPARPPCPICLARGTRIATPGGESRGRGPPRRRPRVDD